MAGDWKNKLYFGDNQTILRELVDDNSVDLVYLDPPFNSNASYNVLFAEKGGEQSAAQIRAFGDTWHWGLEAEHAFCELVTGGPRKLADLMQTLRAFLGSNDMMAYLTMMAPRLVELHRVLKPTGSIWLHCDPTASHYLKLVMDAIFGPLNFKNQITWKRTHVHGNSRRRFADVSDTLLFYAKGNKYTFKLQHVPYSQEYLDKYYRYVDSDERRYQLVSLRNPGMRPNLAYEYKGFKPHANGWAVSLEKMEQLDAEGRLHIPPDTTATIREKYFLDEMPGIAVGDVWDDIPPINSQARERLGYPTQKPEGLLERVIKAGSNEGDLVLDPFCGCGTSIAVAERLNRSWIGIDITHLAITLMRHRLHDAFPTQLSTYEVIGDPKDLASAAALALEDRYQFQWWSLGLVDARPTQDERKKGADSGIDGHLYFFDDNSGKAKKIVISVKSGHVKVGDVRDLKGVLQREQAAIGCLITLQEPTRPMLEEAAAAGFYKPQHFPDHHYPRLQILTIEDLLKSRRLEYPRMAPTATFKPAPRRDKVIGVEQPSIFDETLRLPTPDDLVTNEADDTWSIDELLGPVENEPTVAPPKRAPHHKQPKKSALVS